MLRPALIPQVLPREKTSIFTLTPDKNHKGGHGFECVKGPEKEGVAAWINKKRKQLLNVSIVFKAVQMLREQDEVQTPSSGDTWCHRVIENERAEQAGGLDHGVSARHFVTKSHYP